jgi:phosphate transport system substrate-binding protein
MEYSEVTGLIKIIKILKLKKMMKINIFFSLIISAFLISSCGNKKTNEVPNTPTSGKITIVVDETFKPIMDAEIDVFHALYTNAHIDVIYKTETEALNDLFHDSTQLIVTSRELSKNEIDYFKSKKFFPKSLKIAIDGIALITNKANKDTLLSVETLEKILTGEITQWNQISPKSNKGEIKLVFDNKNSSTVRFMLDSVLRGKKITGNITAFKNNEEILNFIKTDKSSIGVIGVSWISDKDDSVMRSFLKNVNVLAISRQKVATPNDSYQPYQGYIAQGNYALTRNIYFINNDPRYGLATGFAAFLASERGQRIILKSGILPATQPYRIIEIKQDL